MRAAILVTIVLYVLLACFAPWGSILLVTIIAASILGYFAPLFIASGRGHPNVIAIGALNILLGWTLLGWVVAFVWALTAFPQEDDEDEEADENDEFVRCPLCAEEIRHDAVLCRFCGTLVAPTAHPIGSISPYRPGSSAGR